MPVDLTPYCQDADDFLELLRITLFPEGKNAKDMRKAYAGIGDWVLTKRITATRLEKAEQMLAALSEYEGDTINIGGYSAIGTIRTNDRVITGKTPTGYKISTVWDILEDIADANRAKLDPAQVSDTTMEEAMEAVKQASARIRQLEAECAALRESRPRTSLPAPADLADLASVLTGERELDLAACVDEFRARCRTALPEGVHWPTWCDPASPGSALPYAVAKRMPVCLTGESGTGKTFVAEAHLASVFGEVCVVPCHEDMSWQEMFLRTRVKDGKTYYVLGILPMAMLAGVPILIDEVGHLRGANQSQLHEVVDKQQCHLPEIGQTIRATGEFRIVLTDNGLGDDTGQYDAYVATALRTRMCAIKVQFPDPVEEAAILRVQTTASSETCQKTAKLFRDLRVLPTKSTGTKVEGPFSVRESVAFASIFTDLTGTVTPGQAAMTAASMTLLDKRTADEAAVIHDVVSRHFESALSGVDGSFLASLGLDGKGQG